MSEYLIVFFVLVAWLVAMTAVGLVIRVTRGRPTPTEIELEELRARYARAELTHDEYEQRRRALGDAGPEGETRSRSGPSAG
jgi:uncharacterized membrane protein